MPLLRKSQFARLPPPGNLHPNDEIFYCKLTGEVFNDYEKFFQRIILCNSLVWTCTITGRPNMTFSEALHSEKRAQEQLNNFPAYLQSPLLYLAHLTHRSRLNDVVDDVYVFSKDRFFVGESVFVLVSNERKPCKILEVIPPDDVAAEANSNADESTRDSDVICLDDDEPQPPQAKKIKLSESLSKEDEEKSSTFGPNPLLYRYVVQEPMETNSFTTEAKSISRKKGLLSRDKCKLFLKQHCVVEEDGIWRVKAKYAKRSSLATLSFTSFFAGPLPKFTICEAKKRRPSAAKALSDSEKPAKTNVIDLTEEDESASAAKKVNQGKEEGSSGARKEVSKGKEEGSSGARKEVSKGKEGKEKAARPARPSKAEKLKKQETEAKNIEDEFRRMRADIEERAKKREEERIEKLKEKELRKEELKKKADELRQKRKEENEKKKLERKEKDALLRELNKPREDLECDDLKDLPAPTPVSCGIPNEAFGDAALVLEYLLCFQPFFEFNLPKNISVDHLAKALNDVDVEGLFGDLVRELLSAIFSLQDDEQPDGNDEKDVKGLLDGLEEYEDKSSQDLVRAATVASQWPVLNYGIPLHKLQLDGYTLTEVVRLHILSSGSLNGINSKYDYQQRGGYSVHDDPGLVFRQEEVTVLRALGERNIFDLTCVEKLKIVSVLIHQLLTYVISRDAIDDNCERLKQIQKQLREHQWAEHRRDKDETHFRWKKRTEGRMYDSNSNRQVADDETSVLKGKDNGKKQLDCSKQFLQALKTKDYENMPTENLNWDKISPAERAQAKEWFARREQELMDLAVELQHSHSVCPIGRDRTFRRFWVFRSIPGLFVEDQEDLIPSGFFQPVAQVPAGKSARGSSVNEDGSSEGGKSDKENLPVDGIDEGGGAGRPNGLSSGEDLLEKADSRFTSVYEQIASRGKVRWAFYGSPDEVDRLIDSLNPRGVRENPLRSALVEQKERLKDCVGRCNSQLLCEGKKDASGTVQEKRGRSRSKQTPNVVKYGSAQECLESSLREMLLDIEERIDAGSLGSLKVNRRDEWRQALEEGRHDSQWASLTVAGKPMGADGYPKDEHQRIFDIGGSREAVSPVVRDLASALLQIEQMIDHRYLEAPLGNEALKKAKLKAVLDAAFRDGGRSSRDKKDQDLKKESASIDSDEDGSCSSLAQHRTALERWEESLMSSTSLPQIFLHLAVLESSIIWSKSALHARCRICRRKGDGERMLLCDSCDRGHHMYCLKPPVKHVPAGDWFCPTCRPKDVPHTPRKQRKSFVADVSEDDDESESASTANQSRVYSIDESDEEEAAEEDDDDGLVEETEEEEENTEEEEEEEDEDSETETDVRPTSAKIKFVKGTKSRKSTPSQLTPETSASRAKTRLRGAVATSNASSRDSSLDGTPPVLLSSKQRTEPANSQSKYSFYQSGTSTSGVRRSGDAAESPESLSKRSRNSLEEKTTSRKSLPENYLNDESSDKGSFVTKSRAKEKATLMKTCEDLVTELTQRDDAWPFLKPVTRREAPDYFEVIKKPMDFSLIRNKVNRFEYVQPTDVLLDVQLIFANCREYNMPSAPVFAAGQKLESHFLKRLRELELTSLLPNLSGTKSSKGETASRELRKRTL